MGKKGCFWREVNRKMTSTDLPQYLFCCWYVLPSDMHVYWVSADSPELFQTFGKSTLPECFLQKGRFWQGSTCLINFPLSDRSVYRVPINVVALWLVFALRVAPVPRMLPTCCMSLMLHRPRTPPRSAAFRICSWVTFLYLLKGGDLEMRTQITCPYLNWKLGEGMFFWAASCTRG